MEFSGVCVCVCVCVCQGGGTWTECSQLQEVSLWVVDSCACIK